MSSTIETSKPMAPVAATGPTATRRRIIEALAPLRERLTSWPAVLPSEVGDPVRPLKIGVRDDLAALLPAGEAPEVLNRVLRDTRSTQYLTASICVGRPTPRCRR